MHSIPSDLLTKKLLSRTQLSAEAYTCLLSPSAQRLYISAWGGRKIWIYDTQRQTLLDSVATEDHPNDMALDRKGRFLYVANANTNSVSIIDLKTNTVVETLHTALAPNAPIGSTTNSVALDEKTHSLYIANADNNYLAVFDISRPGHSIAKGFIPVGWYPPPACGFVNGNLLVANGKGLSSLPNPYGPDPMEHTANYKHSDITKRKGPPLYRRHAPWNAFGDPRSGCRLPLAVIRRRSMPTPLIRRPSKTTAAPASRATPFPGKKDDPTPIKYVFYVLKENRTYDQVLGDLPAGNGDSTLCLFGRDITPNAHAITQDFVLLDNFYVNAEVSADGFITGPWPATRARFRGELELALQLL